MRILNIKIHDIFETKSGLTFEIHLTLSQYVELKRRLKRDYGWPDNLNSYIWVQDRERVFHELNHSFKRENPPA